jgi:hypothetical protein
VLASAMQGVGIPIRTVRALLLASLSMMVGLTVQAQTCTTVLPDAAAFPISFSSIVTQHVVWTDSSGNVTVSDTQFSGAHSFLSPLVFATKVFGLQGPDVFRRCDGVFPSRSGSLVTQSGILAITTTVTAGGGLLHMTEDARNNQSPNEQPCKTCPDDIHTVNTYDYNESTGAYTYATRSDRNSSGVDPSNNVSYVYLSVDSGSVSGSVVVTSLTPRFSEEEKTDFELLSEAFGKYFKIIGIVSESPACITLSLIVPCEEAAAAALIVAGGGQIATGILAADPIDSNYKVIATPVFPPLPLISPDPSITSSQTDALTGLLTNFVQEIGYVRAIITANNRFQGAAAAGDAFWQAQQLRAADFYGMRLSQLLTAQPVLRANLQTLLQAAALPGFFITEQMMVDYKAKLVTTGFSNSLTQGWTLLGFTGSEIDNLRTDLSTITVKTPLSAPAIFTDSVLDSIMSKAAASLRGFAADRNNDQKVDCLDIAIIRSAFGKREGQAGFDARADVNMDGLIDVRDLAFVSQQLPAGTQCR